MIARKRNDYLAFIKMHVLTSSHFYFYYGEGIGRSTSTQLDEQQKKNGIIFSLICIAVFMSIVFFPPYVCNVHTICWTNPLTLNNSIAHEIQFIHLLEEPDILSTRSI